MLSKMLEITPNYNNFSMVWHEFFPHTSMTNYTIWQHSSIAPLWQAIPRRVTR